ARFISSSISGGGIKLRQCESGHSAGLLARPRCYAMGRTPWRRPFIRGRFDILDCLPAFGADAGRVASEVVAAVHANAVFAAEFHAFFPARLPPQDNEINWRTKYHGEKCPEAASVIVRGVI